MHLKSALSLRFGPSGSVPQVRSLRFGPSGSCPSGSCPSLVHVADELIRISNYRPIEGIIIAGHGNPGSLGGIGHRQSMTYANLVITHNGIRSPQRQLAEAMGTALAGQGEIRIRMCNVGSCQLTVNALAAITEVRVWSTDGVHGIIPWRNMLYSDPPGTNIPAPLPYINTPTNP